MSRSSLYTVKAIEPMFSKFLANPSTFALTSAHVAHYVFDDDNLIVCPPKADDNSCVFVYSIHEH